MTDAPPPRDVRTARWVWEREGSRLVVDGERVTLSAPDGTRSGTLDELGPDIRARMGLGRLAEARAVIAHPERFQRALPDTRDLRDRPRIKRHFGQSVRGRMLPSASISSGRVTVWNPGHDPYRASIADVVLEGIPQAYREALGDEDTDRLLEACRTLASLPCECGTGQEPRGGWRHLRRLVSERDPRAPIEVNSTVCLCEVCGRLWTVGESGDSHYGWRYTASAFGGRPG